MSEKSAGSETETMLEHDPSYLNSLRELYVMGWLGVISMVWSIGYCALFAYRPADANEPVRIIAGIPSWVLWGIALPWGVCSVVTIWFALFYIKEDDSDLLQAEALAQKTPEKSESDVL